MCVLSYYLNDPSLLVGFNLLLNSGVIIWKKKINKLWFYLNPKSHRADNTICNKQPFSVLTMWPTDSTIWPLQTHEITLSLLWRQWYDAELQHIPSYQISWSCMSSWQIQNVIEIHGICLNHSNDLMYLVLECSSIPMIHFETFCPHFDAVCSNASHSKLPTRSLTNKSLHKS